MRRFPPIMIGRRVYFLTRMDAVYLVGVLALAVLLVLGLVRLCP